MVVARSWGGGDSCEIPCEPRYLVHTRPFSIRLLSLGAGGTLPTHAFCLLPATDTRHVAQSPFLQLVGTYHDVRGERRMRASRHVRISTLPHTKVE